MRSMSTKSSNCRECVFQRKQCVLGRNRPWNARTCDDYRPYCLVCRYPDEFCHTCRIQGSRRMKPLEIEFKPIMHGLDTADFDCVWQPPQDARR